MIRNIIFDWSGTLVDDLPAVWQATNFVFVQAGRPEMTLAEFRAEFCLPFTSFYKKFTPHIPPPQLETWFHGRFRMIQSSVTALPHAREFLQFCKQDRIRTFLLSTVADEHFRAQALATGFGELIDQPYTGVWDKRQKIHAILADHKLRAEETLFIGDMEHDIETAKHGGVQSCAVLTGYNTVEQLRRAQPDLMVEHLGELQAILNQNERHLHPRRKASTAPPMPVVTVGALIFNATDEVLLVQTHKWSNLWGIPGGKVKRGETAVDALRRELREETSLAVADIKFVLVQDCIHSQEFYREAHFVLLNYTCRCVGEPRVKLNDEAQAYRWVELAAATAMPINQPTRTLLEAVRRQVLAPDHQPDRRMSTISIIDLEVYFHVGVPQKERARTQRLLLTVVMNYDFAAAAATDRVTQTIDYFKVAQKILRLGKGRSWKLIEKLATDVADLVLAQFRPEQVTVTVKKFPIPQANHVAVSLTKQRPSPRTRGSSR